GSITAGSLLVLAGLVRGKLSGLTMGLIGTSLLQRGVTGHCYCYEAFGIDTAEHNPATAVPAREGVKVEKTLTINCPAEKLYSFWREVENLPRVMRHLKSVESIDRERSHWVADGPLGIEVQWDAEVFQQRENELIAWRSLPGGDIETAGSVHFRPLGDRGTALVVSMKYNPPGGKAGANVASLLGSGLEDEMEDDLRRFKSFMEAGETPTTEGQPHGRA
ncbi:MAG: DUF2892 domain-containing protein, partial [Planctomycetes bacterium]|nr:DUF2892 domain-containing protein [Planctomycetota bacterium]